MSNFYNTTNLTTEQLHEAVQKAKSQYDAVLILMKKHGKLSASQCWEKYIIINNSKACPLTSIRRCLSDLAFDLQITKTTEKVKGNYGRLEYIYKFNG